MDRRDQTSLEARASINPSSGNVFAFDGPAGTVVFLVALPLCLGIALASGAPLFAGIIAGIIGGVVTGALSGSNTSVSGPAAGLAVIVAGAIGSLGSYETFLTAVLLAGLLQLAMGVARLGAVGDYFPNAVIKGMLAGIGVVITLKQIPHALGYDKAFYGDIKFFANGDGNTLSQLLSSLAQVHHGALLIAAASLAILLLWDRIPAEAPLVRKLRLKLLPAPLLVVLAGIGLNALLALLAPSLQVVDREHLVSLPIASSVSDFLGQFRHPNFGAFGNPEVWTVAVTLAIVASLETLLSVEAADRIDPYRRITPTNRELMAQGVGNMLSALLGGLPITSVIVRSSANVYAGSHTWMSAFIHGWLLLAATMFFPRWLNLIPLASLAAILIVIGFKLTKPALYRDMYRAGWDQFVPFMVTVVAVAFSDLLTGVLIGFACGLFYVIRTNHHAAISVVQQDNYYLLRFNKDASFVNKSELRRKLRSIPENSFVIIDGTKSLYFDHDVYETVEDFQKLAPYRNITVELRSIALNRIGKGVRK